MSRLTQRRLLDDLMSSLVLSAANGFMPATGLVVRWRLPF